jgi:hypothetical protein
MYKVLAFLVLPDEKHNNSKRVRNISLCSLKRSKTKTKTIPDPTPRVQATGYWTAGIRGGAKQQQRGKKAIPLPPSKEKRTKTKTKTVTDPTPQVQAPAQWKWNKQRTRKHYGTGFVSSVHGIPDRFPGAEPVFPPR